MCVALNRSNGILSEDRSLPCNKLPLNTTISNKKHPILFHRTDGQVDDKSNAVSVVDAVRDHFDVKDRDEKFLVHYKTDDESRDIRFELKGVKRRLGQTLSSTGLTM